MSIMPEGGWGDLGRQDSQGTPEGIQSTDRRRSSFLSCRVCESGTLSSRKIFRLSGPAVAIGFILLIPSIAGIILSTLMLLGVIAATGAGMGAAANKPRGQPQTAFDANFRRNCAREFRQNFEAASGTTASMPLVESVCECALSTLKETGSMSAAIDTCAGEAEEGSLAVPERDVAAFYGQGISNEAPDNNNALPASVVGILGIIGSLSAIGLGITSFVGGLLGWLLVMKKRVLKCDYCGAVVNAS